MSKLPEVEQWNYYADTLTGRDKLVARDLSEAINEVRRDKTLLRITKRIVKVSMRPVWDNKDYKR